MLQGRIASHFSTTKKTFLLRCKWKNTFTFFSANISRIAIESNSFFVNLFRRRRFSNGFSTLFYNTCRRSSTGDEAELEEQCTDLILSDHASSSILSGPSSNGGIEAMKLEGRTPLKPPADVRTVALTLCIFSAFWDSLFRTL